MIVPESPSGFCSTRSVSDSTCFGPAAICTGAGRRAAAWRCGRARARRARSRPPMSTTDGRGFFVGFLAGASASSSRAPCPPRPRPRCRPCWRLPARSAGAAAAFLSACAIGWATASRAVVLIVGLSRKNQIERERREREQRGQQPLRQQRLLQVRAVDVHRGVALGLDRDRERVRLRLAAQERARELTRTLHERGGAGRDRELGRVEPEAQRLRGIGRARARTTRSALPRLSTASSKRAPRRPRAVRGVSSAVVAPYAETVSAPSSTTEPGGILARGDAQAERDPARARAGVARRAEAHASPCPRRRGTARCSAAATSAHSLVGPEHRERQLVDDRAGVADGDRAGRDAARDRRRARAVRARRRHPLA